MRRKTFEERLRRLEASGKHGPDLELPPWLVIDYDWSLSDYDSGDWTEVAHDKTITIVRHNRSGEYRALYSDRRTDDEIVMMGGDLAYL